jgi:hypothetical protein
LKFDPTITLGNAITIFTFVVLCVLAWRDLNWRVKIIEEWKSGHEHTTQQALQNITLLREATVKIETLANGQERRLEILEGRWLTPLLRKQQ